ncbi:MAG TPA: tetratricopeptide repeat protein [Candidatus Acidoferrum sp.]|jgi:tetratricopeptide (TPR) repeat protein|nr:tetratricopeptide repeat protein [Candidatus Acidoferrum sp.]
MPRRCSFWGLVLVITSTLAAGCSSSAARRNPREPGVDATLNVGEKPADMPADRLAAAHAHFAAGYVHEMNEETEAALEEYYQSAMDDPGNEELILEVSHRFLQNKQAEKALDLLRRSAAQRDASATVLARLGAVYSQLGKNEQAVTTDRAAIKRDPGLLAGYQNLFLAYAQTKRDGEALKVLDEAAARPDVNAEFLLSLAELYGSFALQAPSLKDKINVRALSVLERAAKLKPTTPSMRLRLADGLNSLGQTSRASQVYLELLKEFPDQPLFRERLHAKLASIYLRGSDSPHATEQLEAILRDDPTNPQVYYYLGRIAYENQKPSDAVEYLRKAMLLNPDFREASFYLAAAQLAANQTSDALATLEKARQKFPGNFDLELWTGLAYSQQKAYPEALRHFTEAEVIAKATDPSRLNHEFYFQIGAACERTGDYDQAARHFEKSLELKPDWPEALNYLGYMWAERGTNLAQARQMLEKAVKAEPKNGAYLDSLGWVHFRLGQPEEALTLVLKAVELSAEPDPTEHDHLGDIYAALKQLNKAREAWAKSLSIEPNDAIRKKIETAGGSIK